MPFKIIRTPTGQSTILKLLRKHFDGYSPHTLVTTGRTFPVASQVDVQVALDEFFVRNGSAQRFGLHSPRHGGIEALGIAQLLQPFPVDLGPLQYDEIDVGEVLPARCVRQALWLSNVDGLPFAVLIGRGLSAGMAFGIQVEIATPSGDVGLRFSERFFDNLEKDISKGRTYRGKVISLEGGVDYTGRTASVKVHRLHRVRREDVILPEKTIALLDSNLAGFIGVRRGIRDMGLSAKKGLLFYGPPGTGKTHTLHYLASELPDHTTLLVTAEQVFLLEHYFKLARFLQPAIIVVEDVDLIARERTHLRGPGEEMLLNKLLNEMDGLREDAEVIFILTTNRPDQLEPALASRPGRIDQAIEFPLPDDIGRAKLARLYGRALQLNDGVVEAIAVKTKGVSAAFIKELMRRSAQFVLQAGKDTVLTLGAVDAALEEMVFLGGSLNLKLLGASEAAIGGNVNVALS
jgi:ATPase family associated with various cellular activities (AAA)